jgi:DNA-binding CsgD family transcriptional regulator
LSLAGLGLTAEQERAYRYFLRNPCADPSTAAADLVTHDLHRLIDELRALGLLDASLSAVPPAAAVDLLVRRRIEQTRRQLAELTSAWDVVTELAEEQRRGRPVQMVEHLPSGQNVTGRIRALLHADPHDFMHMKAHALIGSPHYDSSPFKRALAAGLTSRTLFSILALEDPRQVPYAKEWHALGDLHRITTEPLRELAVVNRSVAFVQADPTEPRAGALQIRQPGAVAMLVDMFEGMWARARDLDDLPLSPIEQQVLQALTRHDTDEAAARSINVSVRKFRAHVADLMARLGADSRFQAGVLAKERGWL